MIMKDSVVEIRQIDNLKVQWKNEVKNNINPIVYESCLLWSGTRTGEDPKLYKACRREATSAINRELTNKYKQKLKPTYDIDQKKNEFIQQGLYTAPNVTQLQQLEKDIISSIPPSQNPKETLANYIDEKQKLKNLAIAGMSSQKEYKIERKVIKKPQPLTDKEKQFLLNAKQIGKEIDQFCKQYASQKDEDPTMMYTICFELNVSQVLGRITPQDVKNTLDKLKDETKLNSVINTILNNEKVKKAIEVGSDLEVQAFNLADYKTYKNRDVIQYYVANWIPKEFAKITSTVVAETSI